MAAQAPFDPGGVALQSVPVIKDEVKEEETQPTLMESVPEHQHQVEDPFQLPEADRGRSVTFPSLYNHGLGYAQCAQVASPYAQPVGHPLVSAFNPQTPSYFHQAYILPILAAQGVEVDSVPESRRPSAPVGRRNSMPPVYHPYNSYRPQKFQGQPLTPNRQEFDQRGARMRGLSGEQLTPSPAKRRKENEPPAAASSIGLFTTAPDAQEAGQTSRLDDLTTTQADPLGSVRARTLSNEVNNPEQGKQIWRIGNQYTMIAPSVSQIFNDEQCDRMLWLALHGIPSQAIAHLLVTGSDAIRSPRGRTKDEFVIALTNIIPHNVPELAIGQGEESDVLIQRLLDRANSLYWSPADLKRAVDYTFITENDASIAKQKRKRNARERKAVPLLASKHDENSPNSTIRHETKAETRAVGGMVRRAREQEMIEKHFGYRENTQDIEKALMKAWLLKIRELSKLPDSLDEGEVASA